MIDSTQCQNQTIFGAHEASWVPQSGREPGRELEVSEALPCLLEVVNRIKRGWNPPHGYQYTWQVQKHRRFTIYIPEGPWRGLHSDRHNHWEISVIIWLSLGKGTFSKNLLPDEITEYHSLNIGIKDKSCSFYKLTYGLIKDWIICGITEYHRHPQALLQDTYCTGVNECKSVQILSQKVLSNVGNNKAIIR